MNDVTNRALGLNEIAVIHPDRLAVVDDRGARITYGELDRRVNQLIHGLAALGVHPGDVIGVLAPNRVETIIVHQAAYRGGLYFVPVNPRLRFGEVRYLIENSEAKVLLSASDHLDLADKAVDGLDCRVLALDGSDRSVWDTIAAAPDDPVEPLFGMWLGYTSGTSGRPKGVVRDVGFTSPADARSWMAYGLQNYGLDPDHDIHIVTAPLYHGGPTLMAMYSMNVGGTLYLMEKFDSVRFIELADGVGATSTYLVPTTMHRMLRLPLEQREGTLGSLRSILHTAAPCPVEVKRKMIEWVGPILIELYGSTEGYGGYSVIDSVEWLKKPGTVGRPDPGTVTIRDSKGTHLPAGEIGQIYAAVLPGVPPFRYKDDPKKTAAVYAPDGQFAVGDLGYFDDDGYLFLAGRETDMVISGGVNIYPAETEHTMIQHQGVADVGIVGVPDEEWGERLVAFIQPEVSRSADTDALRVELDTFLRERVAAYKVPREYVFMDDLGRDPSGKLRKRYLRDNYLGVGEGVIS